MSDKVKTAGNNARSAYQKEWRRKNPAKIKEYQDRYWERRAMREQLQQKEMRKNDGDNKTVSDD